MKFMLMMHAPAGRLEDCRDRHLAARGHQGPHRVHDALQQGAEARPGELVGAEGLAGPERGRIVRAAQARRAGGHRRAVPRGQGVPRRLLDRGRARAPSAPTQIAARASAAPGPGGVPLNMPIEVRQVMSAPPADDVTPAVPTGRAEHLLRELAPQVLGAVVRRYRDFAAAEDAVQEALLAAALQWPRDGRARQPARLADPGRRAPPDRRRAQPSIARRRREAVVMAPRRRAERRRRARRRRGRRRGARRHARAAVHVLPPGADAGLGDRADAARGRRPDDRRDRAARSWCPKRRWRSASAAPSSASRPRACRSALPTRERARRAARRRAARALPDLQRGLREQRRPAICSARDLANEAIRLARAPCTALLPRRRPRSPACSR